MDVAIVSSPAAETTPELSAGGLALYFASQRSGGQGSHDIMVSMRPDRTAAWLAPVFVPELSSASLDASPTATTDGLMIVFASNRSQNHDIWISTRARTSEPWGGPVNATSTAIVP